MTNRKMDDRMSARRCMELSAKELEVIALVLRGDSTKEISDELQVAESTVKFHLTAIYRLTGLKTRARFMANYYKTGSYYPPAQQMQQQGEQNAEG